MRVSMSIAALALSGALAVGQTAVHAAPMPPLSAAAKPDGQAGTVQVRFGGGFHGGGFHGGFRGGGWRGGGWGWGVGALVAGALVGAAVASPYYWDDPYDAYGAYPAGYAGAYGPYYGGYRPYWGRGYGWGGWGW